MAEVKRSFGARLRSRLARAVDGDELAALQRRVEVLEAEVQECRRLNIRLAELTDVIEQLLLPIAQRDDQAIAAAVEKYAGTV